MQECSPYAAHLYDAEDANTPMRILPGLCQDFCAEYWFQCRYTLSLLLEDISMHQYANMTAAIEEDRKRFCDFLELRDKQYCYPNVLTNTGTCTWAADAHINVHSSNHLDLWHELNHIRVLAISTNKVFLRCWSKLLCFYKTTEALIRLLYIFMSKVYRKSVEYITHQEFTCIFFQKLFLSNYLAP